MNKIIVCEDLDFLWSLTDIKLCKSMWIQGFSIPDMARALERDVDEVTILIMDLSRKEEIQNRVGGARGKRV
jgi:fructose-1,6-bisphosphatase/sedoheptulose 1,7-bisphosphatase-like protein